MNPEVDGNGRNCGRVTIKNWQQMQSGSLVDSESTASRSLGAGFNIEQTESPADSESTQPYVPTPLRALGTEFDKEQTTPERRQEQKHLGMYNYLPQESQENGGEGKEHETEFPQDSLIEVDNEITIYFEQNYLCPRPEGEITIHFAHNGRCPRFRLKVQTGWSLEHVANVVIPKQQPKLFNESLCPKGYDDWNYDGFMFFKQLNVSRYQETPGEPLRFDVPSDTYRLDATKPISNLGLENMSKVYIYLDLKKDGKKWVEHFPMDSEDKHPLPFSLSVSHNSSSTEFGLLDVPASTTLHKVVNTIIPALMPELLNESLCPPGCEDWTDARALLVFHNKDVIRGKLSDGSHLQVTVPDIVLAIDVTKPISELGMHCGGLFFYFPLAGHTPVTSKNYNEYSQQENDPTGLEVAYAEKDIPTSTIDLLVYHNCMRKKFEISVVPDATLAEVMEHICYDKVDFIGRTDADGHWHPNGYPKDKGWVCDGIAFYEYDHNVDIIDESSIPNRFQIRDKAKCYPTTKSVSELNIIDGDIIFMRLLISRDNKDWLPQFELDDPGLVAGIDFDGDMSDLQLPLDGRSCPESLKIILNEIDESVARLMKTDERFNPLVIAKRITTTKRKLQKESRRARKEELRRVIKKLKKEKSNLPHKARMMHVRTETMWDHPECVDSIRYREEWEAKVWISAEKMVEVTLESRYVWGTLLSRFAYKNKTKYHTDRFKTLAKYDRKKAVDEEHFVSVQKVKENSYAVTDCKGHIVTDLTLAWVHKHLHLEIWSKLKDVGNGTSLRISQGSSCGGIQMGSSELPKIHYRNEASQCLLKCFASALHYLGLKDKALIISHGYSIGYSSCDFALSMAFIRDTMHDSNGRKFPFRKLRSAYCALNTSYRPPHPILASLKAAAMGKNGKMQTVYINHCVCFVDEYVFDSNRETALPINTKSLDEICHHIVRGSTYAGIYWSRELLIPV